MSEENSTTISELSNIATDAASFLLAVVPALSPYGAAVNSAFAVVSAVAPDIYDEIKALIARIHGGTEPSADDVAKLQGMIDDLNDPAKLFHDPADEPPAPPVTGPVTEQVSVSQPTRNGVPL